MYCLEYFTEFIVTSSQERVEEEGGGGEDMEGIRRQIP